MLTESVRISCSFSIVVSRHHACQSPHHKGVRSYLIFSETTFPLNAQVKGQRVLATPCFLIG